MEPTEELPEELYQDCLGIDRKVHTFLPWENTTKCGVRVFKKNLTTYDRINHSGCYECTY